MPDNYTAHVVSHTHWDREWYKPFQHFRMRLVELTDALLDLMEANADFKYWMFDGQVIVLEDYLAIRPENEQRLRKLTEEGRILIGPWYNQPDEFLVSGESLIRNLMEGKKRCDDFGNFMAVGYVPDCFGHISQFPQILQGFGIDNAAFFRGITADQVKSEFTWKGADGSEVLAVKLPDNNAYSNWFYRLRETLKNPNTPVNPDQATEEVKGLVEDCIAEKPTTSQLLFMDGCDHVFAQFKTPEIIDIANERLDNVCISHSTLPAFIDAVRAENPELQTYSGELRWTNRTWKLQGLLKNVFSSRIHLKQANTYCETLLEKYVEPVYSWLWMMGEAYPKSYIDLCWNYLLKNSPHDSICGCSVDQVHRDMVYRYDQVKLIGDRLLEKGLAQLASKIGSTADNPDKTVLAAVFNPLSHARTDVVEADIDLPGDWPIPGIRITDPSGEEVPCAIANIKHYGTMEPEPHDIPLGTHRQKVKTIFVADGVPSVGYKAYKIEVLDKPNRHPGTMLLGPDTAENEFLSITISSDGTFYLLDKETDAVYADCLIFEDGGDFGDGWNYAKPFKDKIVTSLGAKSKVSVVEDNAVRVVFEIETDLELPASAHANRQERSLETIVCKAKSYVTLTSGIKRVDIKTVFDNRAKDHRLRVIFPTGIPATVSHAESAFDVVERRIALPPCTDWVEPLPPAHPQKTFVDISGGGIGLTLINRGLPEYEVTDDEARTMKLNLLRAVGNGVNAPDQQVEGQMIGEYAFEYALYPHAGTWSEAGSHKQAHAFNAPLIVGQTGIHEGNLPLEGSFVSVDGDGFVLSAVKKAEADETLVVRGYNIDGNAGKVKIGVPGAAAGELVALSEESIGPLDMRNSIVSIEVGPKQIVTLKLGKAQHRQGGTGE